MTNAEYFLKEGQTKEQFINTFFNRYQVIHEYKQGITREMLEKFLEEEYKID